MVLKINGIDLFALDSELIISMNGLKISLNDLDSNESGRVEVGIMFRKKIAEVHTIKIKFIKMKPEKLSLLMKELRKPFVTVEFTDPYNYPNVTTTEFSNTVRDVGIVLAEDDELIYDETEITLIGRGIPIGGSDNW